MRARASERRCASRARVRVWVRGRVCVGKSKTNTPPLTTTVPNPTYVRLDWMAVFCSHPHGPTRPNARWPVRSALGLQNAVWCLAVQFVGQLDGVGSLDPTSQFRLRLAGTSRSPYGTLQAWKVAAPSGSMVDREHRELSSCASKIMIEMKVKLRRPPEFSSMETRYPPSRDGNEGLAIKNAKRNAKARCGHALKLDHGINYKSNNHTMGNQTIAARAAPRSGWQAPYSLTGNPIAHECTYLGSVKLL